MSFLAFTLLLHGCKSKPRVAEDVHEEIAQSVANAEAHTIAIPESVTEDLLRGFEGPVMAKGLDIASRFEVSANNVEINHFFAGLVSDTPYSVIIHPSVSGQVSLDLRDVTLEQVFDIVSQLYQLDVRRVDNVYQVYPAQIRTESIPINYLLMKRNGISTTSVNSGGVSQLGGSGSSGNSGQQFGNQNLNNLGGNQSGQQGFGGMGGQQTNGSNIQTQTDTDFWKHLTDNLKVIIGEEQGRHVIVSPQSGLVTVRAMPSEIAAVKDFLSLTEQSLQRQVVLEAKIIEVSLNDEYQQGIDWNSALASVGSTDFVFQTSSATLGNAITAQLGGVTGITFTNQDFSGVVNLLQTQGNVQVLSSPRVTATNNQKAVIKVGQDEYFVTDVSNTTVTGTSTTTTPEISLTPFFSGIALDVTPQIDAKGNVILHVHPSVTETTEQNKVISLNDEQFVLPLAQSNIRETDTIIKAQSGEIVVIGGLMQSMLSDSESKTPLLGDIPYLGELFKNTSEQENKKELVILIRPTVVGAGTWKEQLERSSKLMQKWYSAE